MRLSLSSPLDGPDDLDVDVLPGLPLGALRRHLAVLTGDAGWAGPEVTLTVDGHALADDHPVGAPPLLPGARLARGHDPRAASDGLTEAVAADAHVAVVAGPDAGRVLALPDGAQIAVRGPHGPSTPGRRHTWRTLPGPGAALVVDDPTLTGLVLRVRRRGRRVRVRTRRGPRPRGDVTTLGASTRPSARRLPGPPGGAAWRADRPLRVGASVLEVRGPGVAPPPGRRRRLPPWAWTTVASTAGAVGLAVAMRQPLLLLTAGVGLLALVAALRTPDAPRGDRGGTDDDTEDGAPPAHAADESRPARDVAALRVATAAAVRGRPAPVPGDRRSWPADRAIALVGPRAAALAAARALVLRSLGAATSTSLVLRGIAGSAPGDDWAWARWWYPSHDLPRPDADALVVVDGAGRDLAGWWASTGPRTLLLLVVPPGERVPAWVPTVLALPSRPHACDDARRRRAPRPAACVEPVVEGVSRAVADAQARGAAALAWRSAAAGRTVGPDDGSPTAGPPVAPHDDGAAPVLGALPGLPAATADAVSSAWLRGARRHRPVASVGVDPAAPAAGPVRLDLVRDGPHVLVAGTTGSGKSELLTTLALALALTHPPERLALLLVDFKGGTGLGPLAGLPHVVDHVHDLDVASARRTLAGLRAEVRRREQLLAASGRTDVADLDPADPTTPGRLVVVVDELRALVDDLPEAGAALARLAAQGRALGVHLVLATQRPAGAVPADLRANVNLRIALRVADEADSRDALGVPDAAALDPAAPGRALLRVGRRPAVAVQVARARHGRAPAPVRLAGRPGGTWRPDAAPGAVDDVAAWVAACRAAAGERRPGVPWTPALPRHLPADAVGAPARDDGLLVAVADLPDEQRRAEVRWRLDAGPLLVLGGPRSGRSTTLLTAGTHALHAGAHVHAVGLPDRAVAGLHAAAAGAVGTVVPLDDLHRCLLLLDRLAHPHEPAGAPQVLLLDGLDVLLEDLARHARGLGADLLAALLRRPPAGVHVAAAGPVVAALTRLLGTFPTRFVLPVADPALDPQAGVPADLTGPRTCAGRAVASTPTGTAVAHVVTPSRTPVPHDHARAAPLRIALLPERSLAPAGACDRRLGTGGDGGAPVLVDGTRPLLVAGPHGSGRTTTLLTRALSAARGGERVLLVATRGPDAAAPSDHPGPVEAPRCVPADASPVRTVGPDALADLLDDPGGSTTGGPLLVVDDLDELERLAPEAAAGVERALRSGRPRVAAVATTTEHAATAFRGVVPAVLRHGQVLVLDPHGPAAVDLLGAGSVLHTDPGVRVPGRGVLRRDRRLVRVQVDDHPRTS
ncbi:hypothetical protein LFM56_06080 [Cellulomonas iranensis]|uniref:FtsK/SpoIIIE domain-containing protein n=1 Tax=Cellulomonas iranensis TaxID=76862 RepID=UPI001CF5F628|nr:FtsK/SpoIIIE domain-containing protein [Cellulomonas iranensis]UCN15878.1 hypothetical protein LFM56_06080 [Cellulomonas iranensis]